MHVHTEPEPTDDELELLAAPLDAAPPDADALAADPSLLRRKLMQWYRGHARELPWRGVTDPYRTWVSEVMLQQTRVAAVIAFLTSFENYNTTTFAILANKVVGR